MSSVAGECRFVHRSRRHPGHAGARVDDPGRVPHDPSVAEYALVTAVVASLALSLATIPERQLAKRLPVTAARAQALVSKAARANHVPVGEARSALARAPYGRAPLRYLYVEGWIAGEKKTRDCVLAKAAPGGTQQRMASAIRANAALRARLVRMKVTVAQAAEAVMRGTASAC